MYNCSNQIEKYQCQTCCNFRTNTLVSLKFHIIDGHTKKCSDGNFYKCLKCRFVTFSKFLMVRHSYCCGYTTRSEDEIRQQIMRFKKGQSKFNSRVEEPKEKDPLSLTFERRSTRRKAKSDCPTLIKSHQFPSINRRNFQTQILFGCEHCPAIFKQKEYFKNHLEKCRQNRLQQPVQWFTCKNCPHKFSTISGWKQHNRIAHPKFDELLKYKHCSFKYKRRKNSTNQIYKSPWFKCTQCSFKSKQNTKLKRHIIINHWKPPEIPQFKCDECPFKAKQKDNLIGHINVTHSKLEDIQWFKCEQCPSKFKQNVNLKQHIKLCHPNPADIKWWKCEHCSYKSTRKGNLSNHTKIAHAESTDNRFECEYCSHKFTLKGNLKAHIKVRHAKPEDIQWFYCDQCPSKFKVNGTLQQHLKLSHRNVEEWFKCKQCLVKFKVKENYIEHTNTCSYFQEIEWIKCTVCSFKTKHKDNLTNHMNVKHLNPEDIQWFQCEHCSSKFKQKGNLTKHVKLHHSEIEESHRVLQT